MPASVGCWPWNRAALQADEGIGLSMRAWICPPGSLNASCRILNETFHSKALQTKNGTSLSHDRTKNEKSSFLVVGTYFQETAQRRNIEFYCYDCYNIFEP